MSIPSNFALYRKFPDVEQANELADLLRNNKVEVLLSDNSPGMDLTFSGSSLHNEVELFIPQEEFARVDKILANLADKLIKEVEEDYYLFEFSNAELRDLLLKQDEWSAFDVQLARKLLQERGEPMDDDELDKLRQKRIEDLARPETSSAGWIWAGYITAFLGGFFGLMLGWYLWNQKKTLPDGSKVFRYSTESRIHGRRMVIIGLACSIIWTLVIWLGV
ncbi:hypothetical protein KFE98_01045 [bacterium SCSIO 12741]|nr:hypothetical protein KFE98_01045 [bacterium SCSIO 12741]